MYGMAQKIWPKKKTEAIADRRIKGKHLEPIWRSSGDNY